MGVIHTHSVDTGLQYGENIMAQPVRASKQVTQFNSRGSNRQHLLKAKLATLRHQEDRRAQRRKRKTQNMPKIIVTPPETAQPDQPK